MLIYAPSPVFFKTTSTPSRILAGPVKSSSNFNKSTGYLTGSSSRFSLTITSLFAACAVLASAASGAETETLSNIPQTLSGGECASVSPKDCKKARIQRPKSRKAESCTIKCVTTCIRGGEGSPGEGPLNVRRPMVVFKQGFRSRNYCLVECSDICNLIGDGDDGP
ncbi:Mitochondrial import inner membrane translocase [Salix suchowensis]|nr:Mitochondrial import inner membrane translocase [Salix suchowensis]